MAGEVVDQFIQAQGGQLPRIVLDIVHQWQIDNGLLIIMVRLIYIKMHLYLEYLVI